MLVQTINLKNNERMKKFFLLIVLVAFSCQRNNDSLKHSLMNQDWEFKMISSGDNRPNFGPTNDSIHFIPILLNQGFELEEIREHFNWTKKSFDKKVETLYESEFLKKDKRGIVKANVLIFTIEDGITIRKSILPVVQEITESIIARYEFIVSKTKQIDCLKGFDFEAISLYMLSNILLDDGQIENVEREYLKVERPLRGGKRYYAAYLGKEKGSLYESFGIYGNQMEGYEGFSLCRYGNQRWLPEVMKTNESLKWQYKDSLKRKELNIPVITEACNQELLWVANDFKPELLRLLRKYDSTLRKGYLEFTNSSQLNYEEYFIWLYHILYTEITENLIDRELIEIPEDNVSFYILQF